MGRRGSYFSSRPPFAERVGSTPKLAAGIKGMPIRGVVATRRHPSWTSTSMRPRSEEHTSELLSPCNLVCRLLLEKKKKKKRREIRNIKYMNEKMTIAHKK